MMSIGVLGFVVWSWILASPHSDMGVYNFAICWNSLVLIGTLYGKNLISYTQSADNLSLYSLSQSLFGDSVSVSLDNKQSVSETTRDTSLKFSAFRVYYNTLFNPTPPVEERMDIDSDLMNYSANRILHLRVSPDPVSRGWRQAHW